MLKEQVLNSYRSGAEREFYVQHYVGVLYAVIMSVCYKGVLAGMELSCTHYLL